MRNLVIKNDIPPIEIFPNDNICRVVWAYGSIQKGSTRTYVPEIHILLVDLFFNTYTNKFELTNRTRIIKISIAQLDIARYMTIWRGNRRLNGFWENFSDYKSNVRFELDTTNSISVKYSTQNQDKTYSYLFPSSKYRIENINIEYFKKFTNATFTKISQNNVDVIVPSMELFTSTYTPHEQQIRNKIMQISLNDVLNEYVKTAVQDGGKYIIELLEEKVDTNIVFLAYTSLNQTTRQRLSKIRASLENGFIDKYPVILPYHPSSLTIEGDGFWVNDKTFFMFRINKYSLPDDFEIELKQVKIEVEDEHKENDNKNKTCVRNSQSLEDYELGITNLHKPHVRHGYLSIISEVGVLSDSKHKITKKNYNKTIEAETKKVENENIENIENVSSGEADGSKDSEKTANINIKQESTKLHQSKALESFLNSIIEIKNKKLDISNENSKISITDIFYIDENANKLIDRYLIEFKDISIAKNKPSSFVKKINRVKEKGNIGKGKIKEIFLGYRKCFVLKICLSNTKWFYIIEIERKDDKEGFSGLLIKPSEEFKKEDLENKLFKIIEAKGILKNIKFKNKNIVFRHSVDKTTKNLIDCYLKNFRKIIIK